MQIQIPQNHKDIQEIKVKLLCSRSQYRVQHGICPCGNLFKISSSEQSDPRCNRAPLSVVVCKIVQQVVLNAHSDAGAKQPEKTKQGPQC